ncbi:AraC family transcriptional regulator [Limnohabitans sp.]|uniref:AraC family transcriptional regulator n=1 Tax=Limnohabitans sp. TaxID=1907725 RepID=UPI00286F7980|nr:AraC family transcriptional regulator [Limnohabitans sp.]
MQKDLLFPTSRLPLDGFPVLRATCPDDACERMGHFFSPHKLEVRGNPERLLVHLNQVPLHDLSIHVLRYGTEVTIDPGCRGDFYMLQLPLQGAAELRSGASQVLTNRSVLSVLHPNAPTLMHWSADCTMILLRVSREVIERRLGARVQRHISTFDLAAPRSNPSVAAWWKATEDMVSNLDANAAHWLHSPATAATFEDFLLTAFLALLQPICGDAHTSLKDRCSQRTLLRAKDYIHAHLNEALLLRDIAQHAHVCARTLEALFKRLEGQSPLAYVRQQRLHAIHQSLLRDHMPSVTEVALNFGFSHMGRFAAQYRQAFGCSPSDTLRKQRSSIQ